MYPRYWLSCGSSWLERNQCRSLFHLPDLSPHGFAIRKDEVCVSSPDPWAPPPFSIGAADSLNTRIDGPNGFEQSYTLAELRPGTILRRCQIDSQLMRMGSFDVLFLSHGECKMSTSHIHSQTRKIYMPQVPNADRRLKQHILRALNKIRKPSTAEEITELLNRDLEPGDQPFRPQEVALWLRNAQDDVLNLYWLGTRPRR